MVSSQAATVAEYLAELPGNRREALNRLLQIIRENLPAGYDEAMAWGMICFQVPIEVSGPTYNGQPIGPVALASQKNHISLYLLAVYASQELASEFQKRWLESGKRLDMGKSCVRFKTLEDVDLETIAWAVSLHTPQEFTKLYLGARNKTR